jgi:hypothetical protein
MRFDEIPPRSIAQSDRALRRADQVGEEDGRQHPTELGLLLADRADEILKLVENDVRVAHEGSGFLPLEFGHLGSNNLLADESGLFDCRFPLRKATVGSTMSREQGRLLWKASE